MKGEVVKVSDLKKGDLVTVAFLNGSPVIEQVVVSYVTLDKKGADYTLKGSNAHAGSFRETASSKLVVIRFENFPDNWPPKLGDVWEIKDPALGRTDEVHCIRTEMFGEPKLMCEHGYTYYTSKIETREQKVGKFPDNWKLAYRRNQVTSK